MAQPSNRALARAAGLTRYSTGKPCVHGHVAERLVSNGCCVVCGAAKRDQWAAENPDRRREIKKQWRHANADKVREQNRARYARWYAAHPERSLFFSKRWEAKNHQRTLEKYARYRAAHPQKMREQEQIRRARKLGASGKYGPVDVARIFASQKGRCAYCRVRLKRRYHVDHIKPLARGGSNWPANLQLLCQPCNLSKGVKDPVAFAQRRGLLL